MKPKVFISFDYDNNLQEKNLLVQQAKLQQTPFSIADTSIQYRVSEQWELEAKRKISQSNFVIVLCSDTTHTANGIATELAIAQNINKPIIL